MTDAPKVADAGGIPEDLRLLHEASLEMLESQTFEGTAKQVIKLIKRIAALEAENRQLKEQVRTIERSINHSLNEHLLDMKPDWDDSITGFNEAQDIVREVFRSRTQEPAQTEGK